MFYVKGAQRGVYSSYRACLHATSDTKLRNGFDSSSFLCSFARRRFILRGWRFRCLLASKVTVP